MKWFRTATVSVALMILAGCATKSSTQNTQWVYPPMAIPLQASVQQEVQIARLTQLLQRTDLSDEVRAKMLFERGQLLRQCRPQRFGSSGFYSVTFSQSGTTGYL